ncbi:MAG: hypothetical protein KGK17_07980 [Betaproteobacteria bacterium]|nr:hypothetical protein [Betaproteobacteria bacterium]
MTDPKPELIPKRYWGYLALLLWGAAALFLMRHTPYALDEGAAKALILDWSIGDQVANSVVTLGTPDMRALLWLPLGFLWPGQIFAAKVVTALILALTARGLFFWRKSHGAEEEALLATGLLLIAPLTLQQLDALAPGIELLAAFVAGAWLDRAYRQTPRALGGLFFAQLAVCAFSVSLHPAGLAYPLALLWSWWSQPLDRMQQRIFYVGIVLTTVLTLLLRMGWHDLGSWQNPVINAAAMFWGPSLQGGDATPEDWISGLLLLGLLLAVIGYRRRQLWEDFMGRTLLLGIFLGAFLSDSAWGFLGLTLLFYGGLPWLLKPRAIMEKHGFMVQRGWLWVLLLLLSTMDMRADRAWHDQTINDVLSDQDQLIKTFADDVDQLRKVMEEKNQPMPRIRVASQWPARTMLACRCDALALPPAAKDPQSQLALLHGLSHLVLTPSASKNLGLAENLAMLGTEVETISLQPGGVILKVKAPVPAPAASAPATATVP